MSNGEKVERGAMVRAYTVAFLLISAAPAVGQIVHNDRSKGQWLDFSKGDATSLELQAGGHRARIQFTVAKPPRDWPDPMWIGPSQAEMESSAVPERMITAVNIEVDGCAVEQPWPGLGGFAMPGTADLQFVRGHWQLYIGGGDGAESYGITYTFDNQRILARELVWGPVSDEETHYTITVDPDVAPRLCESAQEVRP